MDAISITVSLSHIVEEGMYYYARTGYTVCSDFRIERLF